MSFNPRARVGRDPRCGFEFNDSGVSIHAPAWGATQIVVGVDLAIRFQSTRPRGARRQDLACHRVAHASFNPRARVGRDTLRLSINYNLLEFQSTRPRGARHAFAVRTKSLSTFQSTRPRGARPSGAQTRQRHSRFQSTRPRGARPNEMMSNGAC